LKDGARFRNTEYFRIEESKIKEVEVYFEEGASYEILMLDLSRPIGRAEPAKG
jgi:hypothetical protein